MIELKNIHIQFKNLVIKNGNLQIFPNELTVITGDSGTGKTSLLNILGLLDINNKCDYKWNGNIIEDKVSFQRKYISYVFQDYNAIEDLTVYDNFKVMYNIAGRMFQKEEVNDLLKQVSIDVEKINQKVKSLSGGEKQRLALALAVVKEPQLLLLDEPTANLDEKNALIIVDILHRFKKNCMIVIASHHPDLYQAEHIYHIENQQISEKKKQHQSCFDKKEDVKTLKPFHGLSYAFIHMKRHLFIYLIILLVLSFSLGQVLGIFISNRSALDSVEQAIDTISHNEIMIQDTTFSDGNDQYYSYHYHKFDERVIQQIQELDHVKNVYPYFEIHTSLGGRCQVKDGQMLPDDQTEDASIYQKINYNGQSFQIPDGELITFLTCHQDVKKNQCYLLDENVNSGVFISNNLANMLNINRLDHTKITLMVPTIMGYSISKGQSISDEGVLSEEYDTYPTANYYQEMTVEVQGVFELTDHPTLLNWGSHYQIALDYRLMERMHNEAVNDPIIKQAYDEYVDYSMIRPETFQYKFVSSAYCIEVDDSRYVEDIVKKIQSLQDSMYIKTTDTMKELLTDQYVGYTSQISMIPAIISGISIILICLLFTYTLYGRKKELSFLTANGVKWAKQLPVIDLAVVAFLSMPLAYLGTSYYLKFVYISYPLKYQLLTIVIGIIIIIVICFISFIITKLFYRKLNVIEELKSH